MSTSINELFNSWINWPDSWPVDYGEKEFKTCKNCGREVEYVGDCRRQHDKWKITPVNWPHKYLRQSKIRAIRARQLVHKAVREGLLINLRKEWVKCRDCPKRAICYDHRDYTKPLEVEPVCNGCNVKRGSARFSAGRVSQDRDRLPMSAVERNSENQKKRHLASNKTNRKSCKQVKLSKERIIKVLRSLDRNSVNITLDKKCHSC